MTRRLGSVLHGLRNASGARVLCPPGRQGTQNVVGKAVRRAARLAEVPVSGAHRLRHTFCSHLAMRGAPARAIQELAGHHDLTTTQRFMHLSPAAIENAIRLLEPAGPAEAGHYADLAPSSEARECGGVDGTRAASLKPKASAD